MAGHRFAFSACVNDSTAHFKMISQNLLSYCIESPQMEFSCEESVTVEQY